MDVAVSDMGDDGGEQTRLGDVALRALDELGEA